MLSHLFKLIIKLIGWTPLSIEGLNRINKNRYLVCVFSHTSFYDFLLMILYYFAHPELRNLKTLISPHYYYPIFKWIGGIPATSIHTKNGGQLYKIVEQIKESERAQFLISPKGSILKREWRSGYYYIAQHLKSPLCCIGMDYERKEVRIGNPISYEQAEEDVRQHLYKDLSQIVPLYPEREVVDIRPYMSRNVSFISIERKCLFFILMLIILTR